MSFEVKMVKNNRKGNVLDPQVKYFLNQVVEMDAWSISSMSPDEARQFAIQAFKSMNFPLEQVSSIEELRIKGSGGEIPLRIYTPSGDKSLPVLVYFHGGGWVLNNLDTHDHVCRLICNRVGCVVVSVDYRLAPENKFPAAVEDCFSSVKWVADNYSGLNADPARVAVGGDSAGGNLAAVISIMAKEKGMPDIILQCLVCPVTDVSTFETESYKKYEDGYFLSMADMEWCKKHYLNAPEDGFNTKVSPLLANDLKGLPPALIITAEFDPLRDEAEQYAEKLEESGVAVDCIRYNGMIHDFFVFLGVFDRAKDAMDDVCSALKESLNN